MESLPGHNGTGPGRKTSIDLGNVSSKQRFIKKEKHPLSMLSVSTQGPARPLQVGEQYPTSSPRDIHEKLKSNIDQALKDNLKVRPDLPTLIWVRTNCGLIHFPCAIQLNVGPRFIDYGSEVCSYHEINNINTIGKNKITMNPFKMSPPRRDFQPSTEKFTSILLSFQECEVRYWRFQCTIIIFCDLFHES